MRDIAERLRAWRAAGRAFALATVVSVRGSAPRGPGTALAVDAGGEAVGSISGGCVEGAVYELCREALRTGRPVLQCFGYSDADAFAVGLTCGGVIEVFVQPVPPGAGVGLDSGLAAVASGTPAALARVIEGPEGMLGAALCVTAGGADGGLASPSASSDSTAHPAAGPLERAAAAECLAMLDAGRTGRLVLGRDGRRCDTSGQGAVTFLVESYVPAPRMLVFGAADFAAAVTRIGSFLGYRVTVCDARPVFATGRRFPDAEQVVVEWPHRYLDREAAAGALDGRTVLCVLTHDAKFDIPLLVRALRLPVGYVGAMGSRRTHRDRLALLREAGLAEEEIARLRSPIGLDLGARTPEETAVAVAAEIVAHRRGGGCLPLSAGDGPLHHDRLAAPRPGSPWQAP
jgi:xanthine dehydrogenase accessory factor